MEKNTKWLFYSEISGLNRYYMQLFYRNAEFFF